MYNYIEVNIKYLFKNIFAVLLKSLYLHIFDVKVYNIKSYTLDKLDIYLNIHEGWSQGGDIDK